MVIYASTTKYARINFSSFNTWLESVDTTFGTNRINIPYKTVSSGISTFSPPNNKSVGSYNLNLTTETKNTNFTAENEQDYTATATLTVTDPTPITGKGFQVHVIGGTSTIGGVGYTAGALVYRYYDGVVWVSTDMNAPITTDAVPTDGSTNPVQSNGVFDALALKTNKNRFIFQPKTEVTGVTGEINICSFKINGGAYASTDAFKFDFTCLKSVTASTSTWKVYIGITSGARTNQIMQSAISATNRTGDVTRRYVINSGNLDTSVIFTSNAQSGLSGIGALNTPIAVTMANDLWITITANPTVITESHGVLMASITPLA